MNKYKIINKDEVDISALVRMIWENKILVMVITILFTSIGYYYSQTFDKSKEFTSHITIRLPGSEMFFEFPNRYITTEQYIEEFISNLESTEILVKFAEQNNQIDNFKLYLEKNNIKLDKYFINKFDQYDPDLYKNRYRFRYHESLDGNNFLNDYVNYVKNYSLSIIKNRVIGKINNELKDHERNLKIAGKIDLEKSLIQEMSGNSSSIFFMYPPTEKYYKGKVILEEEIKRFSSLLQKIDNEEFNYNPISSRAFVKATHAKNYNKYVFIGFITGILLSIVIIIFRKSISK
ncbi:Wzz/FepE/Etk N-terminal domain-containing protein [Candidatus Pelagibacter sp. HIMB1495]|uniref:Wzz/FepE/Etk N-terminal domain-containing protein n=1 Tax=unclassified Candidatus Pelagibacter TaxID=2647897 RepID=UPI003F8358FE